NPAYSSQTCASCGHVAKENRKSQAEFECVECGHANNADINAAQNILLRSFNPEQKIAVPLRRKAEKGHQGTSTPESLFTESLILAKKADTQGRNDQYEAAT